MTQPPPTAAELHRECHSLVRAIERKPASIKLLLGARAALRLYAGYKAGRGDRFFHDNAVGIWLDIFPICDRFDEAGKLAELPRWVAPLNRSIATVEADDGANERAVRNLFVGKPNERLRVGERHGALLLMNRA